MTDNSDENPEFDGDLEQGPFFMDEQLFRRFRQLKKDHEGTVAEIDQSISDVKRQLGILRDRLNEFKPGKRKLMTVLIARSIERSLREILLEDTESLN